MSILTIVCFTVGVAALVVGAEVLVRGAARLAAHEEHAVTVLGFVVPLTVLTFVVIAVRERRADRSLAVRLD